MKIWEIIIGLIIAALLGALFVMMSDIKSDVTNVKDQVIINRSMLQQMKPEYDIPDVLAKRFDLQQSGGGSPVYTSSRKLKNEDIEALRKSGVLAIPIELPADASKVWPTLTSDTKNAYIIRRAEGLRRKR